MKTRRLTALEARCICILAAEAGAPFGLTADQVLEEARLLFTLSPRDPAARARGVVT